MGRGTQVRKKRSRKTNVNQFRVRPDWRDVNGTAELVDHDLDILAAAYSVHSIIKKTPPIPTHYDQSTVCALIEHHVVNRRHFDQVLYDAQRNRFFQKRHGKHWSTFDLATREEISDRGG